MPVSGILAIVTLVSYAVKDVSPVVGLTGAILGSFIRVFFSLKFTRAMAIVNGYDSLWIEAANKNLPLVPFGLFIAFLACLVAIKEASQNKQEDSLSSDSSLPPYGCRNRIDQVM